ncbi:hypothetical protein [Comamonas sp.]|uniref:hypothetical protein n=1 Tax=Comamonas sp. TaxID=34028 RepID=UPI002897C042|nr:hypothetical protein [Comamonas sp.]
MMMKIKSSVMLAACAVMASHVFAVQPQNGFWAIDGELTGKPGRGFQIDVQGKTLVFSYYGYRPEGTATFYLSSGPYEDSAYVGKLFEYKNGTVLGEPHKDGAEQGSPGWVFLNFNDATRGTIILPGDNRAFPISRFTFSDPSAKFAGKQFKGSGYRIGTFSDTPTKFDFVLNAGTFNLRRDAFPSDVCNFSGTYTVQGTDIESTGNYQCSDFSTGTYIARNLRVDDNGIYTGAVYKTPAGSKDAYVEYHSGWAGSSALEDDIMGKTASQTK